jgi:hypothetical protein
MSCIYSRIFENRCLCEYVLVPPIVITTPYKHPTQIVIFMHVITWFQTIAVWSHVKRGTYASVRMMYLGWYEVIAYKSKDTYV